MSERLAVRGILFVLALIAAFISGLLLQEHIFKSAGPAWFAAVCGDVPGEDAAKGSQPPVESALGTDPAAETAENQLAPQAGETAEKADPAADKAESDAPGGRSCEKVLAGRWAYIPPLSEEEREPGSRPQGFHIPAAYLGLVYYASLAVWFLFIGRPTPDKRFWWWLPFLFILAGVLSSLFFIVIMFTESEAWCPWCMVTHVLNFLIIGGMWLLRPVRWETYVANWRAGIVEAAQAQSRRPQSEDAPQLGEDLGPAPTIEPPRPHPQFALAVCTILLAAAVSAMMWHNYRAMAASQKAEKVVELAKSRVKQLQDELGKQVNLLYAAYEQGPEMKVDIRPDDPQIANGEILCPMVVFSDLACPSCDRFARRLEEEIRPMFNDRLRITWKHYPLSPECNPYVRNNVHPNACEAARAAEAARMQGGSDAFWEYHDRLFAAGSLKGFDYVGAAQEMGLDPQQFKQDMNSQEALRRIQEDAKQAHELGINSTPTVILMERKVDTATRSVEEFWQFMAKRFLHLRQIKLRALEARRQSEGSSAQ